VPQPFPYTCHQKQASGDNSMEISHPSTDDPAKFPISTGTAVVAGAPGHSPDSYATAAATESCAEKVFVFCERILKIPSARSRININRAHRSPTNPIPGKTRPIIASFDYDSKALVFQCLINFQKMFKPTGRNSSRRRCKLERTDKQLTLCVTNYM
jgi:hypothetical protein